MYCTVLVLYMAPGVLCHSGSGLSSIDLKGLSYGDVEVYGKGGGATNKQETPRGDQELV